MAAKLTTITGQYHSYVADQVLTHYQLNETIDYFDDQNRLSRVFLTGTGIVCGFQVSTNPGYSTVTITQGNGITTDGDLIKLSVKPSTPADIALATALKQKLISIDIPKIDYKSYKVFDIDKGNYPHFKSGTAMLPMWELLPEKTGALETGESLLTSFPDLKNHVVLLYLENYTKEATLCDETDCSNKGGEEVFNLRVLVVSQATANIIISKTSTPQRDPLYSKYDVFDKYSMLEELGVKKVIPTFNNTSTAAKIKQLFNTVVNDVSFKSELLANLATVLIPFGYVTQLAAINTRLNTLFTIDPNNIPADIHYRYDLLKDIVATYKELKDLFLQLKSECNPPIGSFPKHLLLGLVEENNRYKNYRHQFYKASALDQNKTFSNFDSLVRRLKGILDNYLVNANSVKITPSKTIGKLGAKSVPYYYNVDDNLLHAWDFEKSTLYNHQANFSYHTTNLLNSDYIKTPLSFCIDDHDFYRIEGYLNDSVDDVKAFLIAKRIEFGLDFDFYIMDVVENAADLKILFNTNYSFEHKAGVKKGGTLLLLKSGTTLITDFAIDGKINPDSGLGCCTIMGCLYPWISSLRYINNLSRSLRGSRSDKVDLPTHYKLSVKKYTINGVNLITDRVLIDIPLDQLLARRLHVVMETLNNRFPTGLLFDFIEEEKKLRIMRLEKDTFEFEVQDITLSRNAPTYTFTQNGVTKNGKVYSSNKITCAIMNSHKAEIYKKIHAYYDPINKDDDDFGRFNDDWDKFEYLRSQLRFHEETKSFIRFPKIFDDYYTIPVIYNNQQNEDTTVAEELLNIAQEIVRIDDNYNEIYIGGDWTSGNYVNTTMQSYYLENYTDTNDELVLFMNLRTKIHNESKVSKYMIHIDTTRNVKLSDFEELFTKYAKKAEFYFYKPTNGNFIKIEQNRFSKDGSIKKRVLVNKQKITKSPITKKVTKPVIKKTPVTKRTPKKPGDTK
ncbi:hypothetical protein SAMN05444671_4664 [Flavobacterium sp. CF108]|uniref:hypothetical protein n=1 Tax=unclassified Flavobacterium TaxID=196869 RepID=UPI0008D1F6D2|nr:MULTISPECIES: hypothetical protein [unclassified Flavobacterium]SEP23124.1 hypothetical protein SAMN04487978_0152 [Flavobacterium sp. fv08]SHI00491.1 hypothetical protein SAMN05444671_4664 [Flavobacterium sp. CF108]